MTIAEAGIQELAKNVDTLIVIPNQNLFRVANEKTTFADAFAMADQVLYSGVACITDLMVKEGLINLDFADVRAVMREMGKAMMGTGEASGEKRALAAAEAAISNPLIDDSSMKGAKGLLISITGGQDLTLYEVDEAATRIREEVDQDANIIVGATFDEGLDGMIRVAVVATGIDKVAAAAKPPAPADARIAELTQRLRAETQRLAEQRTEPVAAARAAAHAPPAMAAPTMPPAQVPHAQSIEAARAAVAAAVLPTTIEDVTIRPLPPKPTLFVEPVANDPARTADNPPPKTFIPPPAERIPPRTPPRMPRIEDLPIPGQNEMRARRGELPQDDHPEKRRMTLLQRLASVGFGRREQEEEEPMPNPRPIPRQAPPALDRQPTRPAARPLDPRPEPVSEYARRTGPQGLDQHGRASQAPNGPTDDDQLDIPAFLRRQSN
jgi:cell division protein FtsZ